MARVASCCLARETGASVCLCYCKSRRGSPAASKKNESQRPGTNVRGGGFVAHNLRRSPKTVRRAIPFQDRALRLAWGCKPSGTLLAGNSKGPTALIQPAFGNHRGASHNLALFSKSTISEFLLSWSTPSLIRLGAKCVCFIQFHPCPPLPGSHFLEAAGASWLPGFAFAQPSPAKHGHS